MSVCLRGEYQEFNLFVDLKLKESIKIIENNIIKHDEQLKSTKKTVDFLPEDEPSPIVKIAQGTVPPAPSIELFLQIQEQIKLDPNNEAQYDKISKQEALNKIQELTKKIDELKSILPGLKEILNQMPKEIQNDIHDE